MVPTESAALFARQIDAYVRGHDAVLAQLTNTNCPISPTCPAGSIGLIEEQIRTTKDSIDDAKASLMEPGFYANEDAFRRMSGRTGDVVTQLNGLTSFLSNAGFVKQVQTLSDNYAILHASLQSIDRQRIADIASCKKATAPDQSGCAPVENQALLKFLVDVTTELKAIGNKVADPNSSGTPAAAASNVQILDAFLKSHAPDDLHVGLDETRKALVTLNGKAEHLFFEMNDWYDKSSVMDIKPIAPLQNVGNIHVNIALREPHTPFAFVAGTPVSPGAASTLASSTPTKPSHSTLLIEVHRTVYFNAMAGALVIAVPNRTYGALPCSQVPGADPTKTNCVGVTATSGTQVQAMVGVSYAPWGHDYYPYGPRRSANDYGWKRWTPSILIGASVTSLGNAFGGVNFEGFRGIDIYAGAANASSTRLPKGFSIGTTLDPATTLTTTTTQKVGLAFGAGFDFSIFCGLFKASCGS